MTRLGRVGKVSNYGVVACRYRRSRGTNCIRLLERSCCKHIPPECPQTPTALHGVISEKSKISAFIAVKTSHSTS